MRPNAIMQKRVIQGETALQDDLDSCLIIGMKHLQQSRIKSHCCVSLPKFCPFIHLTHLKSEVKGYQVLPDNNNLSGHIIIDPNYLDKK